jgi:hypothetical protein
MSLQDELQGCAATAKPIWSRCIMLKIVSTVNALVEYDIEFDVCEQNLATHAATKIGHVA